MKNIVVSLLSIGYFSIAVCICCVGITFYYSLFSDLSIQHKSTPNILQEDIGELFYEEDSDAHHSGQFKYKKYWKSHKYSINKELIDKVFAVESNNQHKNLWGSFVPDKYFGLKMRSSIPNYLHTGIFWNRNFKNSFRYYVQQDELSLMRWNIHNGHTFGEELLVDGENGMNLTMSFMIANQFSPIEAKNLDEPTLNPTWTQKLHIEDMNTKNLEGKAMFTYFFIGSGSYDVATTGNKHELISRDSSFQIHDVDLWKEGTLYVIGFSQASGWFLQVVHSNQGDLSFSCPNEVAITDSIEQFAQSHIQHGKIKKNSHLKKKQKEKMLLDNDEKLLNSMEGCSNTVYVQHKAEPGSSPEVTIVYYEHLVAANHLDVLEFLGTIMRNQQLASYVARYGAEKRAHVDAFNKKFDYIFSSNTESSVSAATESISKQILSDVLGGIGFFHGIPDVGDSLEVGTSVGGSLLDSSENEKLKGYIRSLADAELQKEKELLDVYEDLDVEPISLLCSTPSRTSFPRGFLWDEGFHELLISRFAPLHTLTILDHWLSAQYSDKMTGVSGWIPREMILGQEATSKVPNEFRTQRVDIANPPTLLLALDVLIDTYVKHIETDYTVLTVDELDLMKTSLITLYSKAHDWIQWFVDSQETHLQDSTTGASYRTYRWKGRVNTNKGEYTRLLPNTLASGLDDYPRSPWATIDQEAHVDLLTWIVRCSKIMKKYTNLMILFNTQDVASASPSSTLTALYEVNLDVYDELQNRVSGIIDRYHWNEELGHYADIGLLDPSSVSTDGKQILHGEILRQVVVRCANQNGGTMDAGADLIVVNNRYQIDNENACPPTHPKYMFPLGDGNGGYLMREHVGLSTEYQQHIVDYYSAQQSHAKSIANSPVKHASRLITKPISMQLPILGYVSVFPFLLKSLPVNSHSNQLHLILKHISNSNELWSNYGIASLSKRDMYYNHPNAPGDPPYWRGPIWLNINYLIIDALHYYGTQLPEEDSNKALSLSIYKKLRSNIVKNVIKEYKKTGYLYEQYSEVHGDAQRGHPFTGWTSLIVNIIYELY